MIFNRVDSHKITSRNNFITNLSSKCKLRDYPGFKQSYLIPVWKIPLSINKD